MNPRAFEAAELLWRHRQAGTTIDGLPEALWPNDAAAGHAIQAAPVLDEGGQVMLPCPATEALQRFDFGTEAHVATGCHWLSGDPVIEAETLTHMRTLAAKNRRCWWFSMR